jgi:hypothetical protein
MCDYSAYQRADLEKHSKYVHHLEKTHHAEGLVNPKVRAKKPVTDFG